MFDPRKEVAVLVSLTWAFQLLIMCGAGDSPCMNKLRLMLHANVVLTLLVCILGRLNALLWYNAWPERPGSEGWEARLAWAGRWLCCQFAQDEQRQRSLRRISRWVVRCLPKLLRDLCTGSEALVSHHSPSDQEHGKWGLAMVQEERPPAVMVAAGSWAAST